VSKDLKDFSFHLSGCVFKTWSSLFCQVNNKWFNNCCVCCSKGNQFKSHICFNNKFKPTTKGLLLFISYSTFYEWFIPLKSLLLFYPFLWEFENLGVLFEWPLSRGNLLSAILWPTPETLSHCICIPHQQSFGLLSRPTISLRATRALANFAFCLRRLHIFSSKSPSLLALASFVESFHRSSQTGRSMPTAASTATPTHTSGCLTSGWQLELLKVFQLASLLRVYSF